MNMAQVVILAGGFGTRMLEKFPSTPKPMILVDGRPILEHIVGECRKYGLLDILLVTIFIYSLLNSKLTFLSFIFFIKDIILQLIQFWTINA